MMLHEWLIQGNVAKYVLNRAYNFIFYLLLTNRPLGYYLVFLLHAVSMQFLRMP